jgi:uncharacterized iron-regulated membrane protein
LSKRIVFKWHHWCGLMVGVFLLLQSITGALLVFSDEIENTYDKQWEAVDNPSGLFYYDASLQNIRDQYPGWEIRLYEQPGINESLQYELRKDVSRKKIFVHPVTGSVLHVSDQMHNQFHQLLLLWHYSLFAGTTGKLVVFLAGILFLITTITGIFIYRRSIIKVLLFRVKISAKSTRGKFSAWHRVIGVWSLLFNIFIVITGLFLSGKIALNALKAVKPAQTITNSVVASVDGIRNNIVKNYKDFEIHLLRVPVKGNTVLVYGRYKSDPSYYGNYASSFSISGYTAQVESSNIASEQTFFNRMSLISGPLHFGNYGGIFLKIIYCFFGLAPAILSISGFCIWWFKKK